MDAHSVTKVLKLRSQLVRHPYGDDTVAAWTEALDDIVEHDAIRAVRDLAAHSSTNIAIPEIRAWLRDEQRTAQRLLEATPGPAGNPLRFASMSPDAIAARRRWWAEKRDGHYPGCPCEHCARRPA